MNGYVIRDYLVIGTVLLVGMILTLLPLPYWAVWWRPYWVLAILIFWMMTAPHRVGVVIAFSVGLFMDLLTGTLLGQQALLFTITAYFILKFQYSLERMPVIPQTMAVFLLILFDLVVDRCVMVLFHHSVINWDFWLPAFTTAMIWPLLSGLLYLPRVWSSVR